MPYEIRKEQEQWCVVNQDDGRSMGCHNTEEGAKAHMAALYANVSDASGYEQGTVDPLILVWEDSGDWATYANDAGWKSSYPQMEKWLNEHYSSIPTDLFSPFVVNPYQAFGNRIAKQLSAELVSFPKTEDRQSGVVY